MKLLFINFDPAKKPALFLLLDDDGKRLVLFKHAMMDKSEIPMIRAAFPLLSRMTVQEKMKWFRKLHSWKTAYRQFTKAKVTILSEYTPK
jgi:ABC-type Na+ transport system ATPase subunit NatA